MPSLTDTGAQVFSFSLITAVVSTVISLALTSSGVPPETFNVPIFIGMRQFYDITYNLYNAMPQNSTSTYTFLYMSSTVLAGSIIQFVVSFLGATFLLIATLAYLLPPEISFLATPLYFIGGFLQVMAWIYMLSWARDVLSSIINTILRR